MPCDAVIDAVVARVLDGDREAFRTIVEEHEHLVRGWIASHSPSRLDADEISHLTFIAAYRSLHRYQQGTDFRAWLMGIARNMLSNELRRWRSEESHHGSIEELEFYAAKEATKESDIDLRPVAALKDCLQHLPADGTDLLQRHYADGCPLQEIADSSGRTLSAIKFRLHWLRRKLADCVGDRILP